MTYRVLGLESSCDETAAAIVEDGRVVRSDVVASQNEVHARYGGVVPELASRAHILNVVNRGGFVFFSDAQVVRTLPIKQPVAAIFFRRLR